MFSCHFFPFRFAYNSTQHLKTKPSPLHTSFPQFTCLCHQHPEASRAHTRLFPGYPGLPPALAEGPLPLAGGSRVPSHTPASAAGSRRSLASLMVTTPNAKDRSVDLVQFPGRKCPCHKYHHAKAPGGHQGRLNCWPKVRICLKRSSWLLHPSQKQGRGIQQKRRISPRDHGQPLPSVSGLHHTGTRYSGERITAATGGLENWEGSQAAERSRPQKVLPAIVTTAKQSSCIFLPPKLSVFGKMSNYLCTPLRHRYLPYITSIYFPLQRDRGATKTTALAQLSEINP